MRKCWAVLLMCFSTCAFAQVTSSNAGQFAVEAGNIGGAAQACGQDISTYNSRVNEAINALSVNASDRQQALTLYEKAMSDVQFNQSKLHNLNCGQVTEAFTGLPIMQSNYETTVIPALAKMNTSSNNTTTTTQAPTPTTQATTTIPTQNTTPTQPLDTQTTPSAPPQSPSTTVQPAVLGN